MISKFWLFVHVLCVLLMFLNFSVSHSYLFSYCYLHHSHDLLLLFYYFHISCALTSCFLLKLQHCDCAVAYDHFMLGDLCDYCDFCDETVIELWNSSFESLFWHEFWIHDITCFKDRLAWIQKSSSKQDLTSFRIKSIDHFLTDFFACLNE